MAYTNNIQVLVADNDAAIRQLMVDVLSAHGYKVTQALDGGAGITVVEEQSIDVAILGHQMYPKTGFDFARHILVKGYEIGMIMITDDPTTDLLLEAGKFEIKQIMRTPIDPDRLVETVRRVLRAYGKNPDAMGGNNIQSFTPEELMHRVIVMAHQNARSRMGGPFGALVADEKGNIIGEGVNGVTTRCDPTAHAEVMAIRRATDRMNNTDLTGCTVYCSSEPTMLGQALIISTGIAKVYYALSHEDVGATRLNEEGILGEISRPLDQRSVPYEKINTQEGLDMFKDWQEQRKKLAD